MDLSRVFIVLDSVIRMLMNLLEQVARRFGIDLNITTTETTPSEGEEVTPEP